jgi:RNA polymerase sigma-70 factor (ECF subfamily)
MDDWGSVYSDTHRLLSGLAGRHAGPEDAADAVAETYARAIACAGRYRPDRPVAAWLVGILRNVLREQARVRTPVAPCRVADDEPEALVVAAEEARSVRAALERLPASDRVIVVLRVVEGRASADVAALTDRTPAAVRMAQTRALRRMEKVLA